MRRVAKVGQLRSELALSTARSAYREMQKLDKLTPI